MTFKEIITFTDYTESVEINGKRIYIFLTHNMALPIWGYESSVLGEPLNLITFDTHTDTQKPFTRGNAPSEQEAFAGKHYKRTDFCFNDVRMVTKDYIRNTEQILAGVKFGYLKSYSVVQNRGAVEEEFEQYDREEGYNAWYFEKEAINWRNLHSIENPFVLDFDLDYFNKEDDLNALFEEEIEELIKRANFITIAKELWHFEDCKLQEDFSIDQALTKLLAIIEAATKC